MRFVALEDFCGKAFRMLQDAACYYYGRDIVAEALSGYSEIIELSSIDSSDIFRLYEYYEVLDCGEVSEELESFLDFKKLHDEKVFEAWKDLFLSYFQCQPKLVSKMLSELSGEDFESVPELSDDYEDMRKLSKDMVAVVKFKMDMLESAVGRVVNRYGLTGMPHLSPLSISRIEEQPEIRKRMGRPSLSGSAFHQYVSSGYDVEAIRTELYDAINGKIGRRAVDIIISAVKAGKLTKFPIPFIVAHEALGVEGSDSAYNKAMNTYKDAKSGILIF